MESCSSVAMQQQTTIKLIWNALTSQERGVFRVTTPTMDKIIIFLQLPWSTCQIDSSVTRDWTLQSSIRQSTQHVCLSMESSAGEIDNNHVQGRFSRT